MSRRRTSIQTHANSGIKDADPGQLDWLSIRESDLVSSEGVEHQEQQACSTDNPAEPDSMKTDSLFGVEPMETDAATIGKRLRAGREQRGWSCEDVAARLKLQARLIRRIEDDDYSGIAHAVYLRGYLTSYARLLDMSLVLADDVVEKLGEHVPLVATGKVSRSRYLLDRYSVSATYLILTALVVGPAVWLATHGGIEQNLARTVMLDAPTETREATVPAGFDNDSKPVPPLVAVNADDQAPATPGSEPSGDSTAADTQPIIASMAPFSAVQAPKPALSSAEDAAVGKHSLSLRLTQSSWVEVTSASGEKLEYGLLEAGVERTYSSDEAVSIRIGNAEGAEVVADGKAIDLAPFRRANVASLRVFSAAEPTADINF